MFTNILNQKSTNRRRGALSVEVAICAPVLFVVLFASFELARANMILHATESAAYEGARVGIVPGATNQKIQDSVQYVLLSVGVKNFTVNVTPNDLSNDSETVEVAVNVNYADNSSFIGFFLKDATFRGKTVLTREVPR